MHSSTVHNKMELLIREAKDLLDHTDALLLHAKQDHDMIREKGAAFTKKIQYVDEKLDDEIRTELADLAKTADDYINSLDT